MPSRNSSRSHSPHIDKLDFDSHRRRPTSSSHGSQHSEQTGLLASDRSFFSNVVEGAISADRRRMARKITKYTSFASAILSCLCAGSITAYSLYGPLFQSHLKYSQYQVNAVSTTAEMAMYLPVPLFGWLCDRYNPRPLSLAAGILFGAGYLLAALTYRAGPSASWSTHSHTGVLVEHHEGWPFAAMVIAFIGVGAGTSCMYLSAVTTCAKNFGRGRHKGIALAMPIAAFGLSGAWQSQVGSHFFKVPGHPGETDVVRYFCFLSGLLFAVGLVGSVGLRIVNEEELLTSAAEDLERSGLLEESPFFQRPTSSQNTNNNYGTLSPSSTAPLPPTPPPAEKKTNLLNTSTRLFLTDPTMWALTLGFFLTSGPGETYINNVGTLLRTLPPTTTTTPSSLTPATHVSIIALTSTFARLFTGTLSDLLAPTPTPQPTNNRTRTITLPRPLLLLLSTLLFSLALLLLGTPLPHQHPTQLFPLISSLVGLGYGAIFSLTPMIVSVVWGVQNFGTNWGIVAVVPAGGAALWGAVYSAVYQRGVGGGGGGGLGDGVGGEDGVCYGAHCYTPTFLAMAVASWIAILAWIWAWRRWRRRGVVV